MTDALSFAENPKSHCTHCWKYDKMLEVNGSSVCQDCYDIGKRGRDYTISIFCDKDECNILVGLLSYLRGKSVDISWDLDNTNLVVYCKQDESDMIIGFLSYLRVDKNIAVNYDVKTSNSYIDDQNSWIDDQNE